MDPNANLREQLALAAAFLADDPEPDQSPDMGDARRLSELVLALSEWICRGGFLPASWVGYRTVKIELCDKLDRRGRTTEVVVGGQVLSRHPSSVSRRAAVEAAELAARTLKAAGVVTVLTEEK